VERGGPADLERRAGDADPVLRRPPATPIAWVPDVELGLAHWLYHGRRLGQIGRGVAWWLGDWLRYGNARFGQKYSRAAHVTGYDPQSLMNMAYVASRFPVQRRRPQLSWSHHAEVAALAPDEQDRWLDLVLEQRLSVRSLRLEVRTARRVAARQAAPEGEPAPAGDPSVIVCPNCQHAIRPPAE